LIIIISLELDSGRVHPRAGSTKL